MDDLQDRLDQAVREHAVVGASIAVLDRGELHLAAAGVADDRTGEHVTADTLFGAWSVTKPMTTMAVLSLAADGCLSLDGSVYDVVPELDGAEDGEGLLVRHLLDCTSGLPGIFFPDVGEAADALSKVVPLLARHRRIHRPGQRWAYSNLGFVVAGVVAERLTGQVWDDVLRERVLDPLGLQDTFSSTGDVAGRSQATNHAVHGSEVVNLGQWWPRSSGPAGGTVVSTAADLSRLGAALATDDWKVMRQRQVTLVDPHMDWALGMAVFDWGAGVVGWDGVGPGTRTFLRVLPDHGVAVALLCSSDNGRAIYQTMLRDLFAERWSVRMAPERPEPADDPMVARSIVDAAGPGEFRCAESTMTITAAEDHLDLVWAGLGPDPVRARPVRPGVFVTDESTEFPILTVEDDVATMMFGFRREP